MMRRRNRVRRVRPQKRTPVIWAADALILFILLAGTLFYSVTAYDIPCDWGILIACCLVFTLISLVVFAQKRFFWPAAIVMEVVLALGCFFSWDRIVAGTTVSVSRAVAGITARTGAPGVFPLPEEWTEQWCAQAATWMLAFWCYAAAIVFAWLIVRRRSALPAFLFSLLWIAPAIGAGLEAAAVPFVALMACWVALGLCALAARSDPQGGARMQLMAFALSVVFAAGLLVISPRATYVQPQWAQDAQQDLIAWSTSATVKLARYLPARMVSWLGFSRVRATEEIDLSDAGPLRYTGRTVLRVLTNEMDRLYLRGRAAAVYTGASWEPLEPQAIQEWRDLSVNALCFATGGSGESSAIRIMDVGLQDGTLYMPYQTFGANGGVQDSVLREDSYFTRPDTVTQYTLLFEPPDNVPVIDPYRTAKAEDDYAAFVRKYYLQVPENYQELLAPWWELSGLQIENSSVYSAKLGPEQSILLARSIGYTLQQYTQYDPATPVTPQGKDFVAYFLNESHRGYCMHYASAAVLLLRMSGIPARYVSGFTVDVRQQDWTDVPDSAAHAWVEIYLDDYGWYPIEVTPGYTGRLPETGGTQTEQTETEHPVPTQEQETEEEEQPQVQQTQKEVRIAPYALVLALVLLVFLFIALRVLFWMHWRRLLRIADQNRAVIGLYHLSLRVQRICGVQAEVVQQLAEKAYFSQHRLTEQERIRAAEAVFEQCEIARNAMSVPKRIIFWYLFGMIQVRKAL